MSCILAAVRRAISQAGPCPSGGPVTKVIFGHKTTCTKVIKFKVSVTFFRDIPYHERDPLLSRGSQIGKPIPPKRCGFSSRVTTWAGTRSQGFDICESATGVALSRRYAVFNCGQLGPVRHRFSAPSGRRFPSRLSLSSAQKVLWFATRHRRPTASSAPSGTNQTTRL